MNPIKALVTFFTITALVSSNFALANSDARDADVTVAQSLDFKYLLLKGKGKIEDINGHNISIEDILGGRVREFVFKPEGVELRYLCSLLSRESGIISINITTVQQDGSPVSPIQTIDIQTDQLNISEKTIADVLSDLKTRHQICSTDPECRSSEKILLTVEAIGMLAIVAILCSKGLHPACGMVGVVFAGLATLVMNATYMNDWSKPTTSPAKMTNGDSAETPLHPGNIDETTK